MTNDEEFFSFLLNTSGGRGLFIVFFQILPKFTSFSVFLGKFVLKSDLLLFLFYFN